MCTGGGEVWTAGRLKIYITRIEKSLTLCKADPSPPPRNSLQHIYSYDQQVLEMIQCASQLPNNHLINDSFTCYRLIKEYEDLIKKTDNAYQYYNTLLAECNNITLTNTHSNESELEVQHLYVHRKLAMAKDTYYHFFKWQQGKLNEIALFNENTELKQKNKKSEEFIVLLQCAIKYKENIELSCRNINSSDAVDTRCNTRYNHFFYIVSVVLFFYSSSLSLYKIVSFFLCVN